MTTEDIFKKGLVYDCETIKGYFLCSFYSYETGEFIDFSINQYRNDLNAFVKFLYDNQDKYFIGFNNISFDNQVIEWIYKNHEKWYDYTGLEIAAMISKFGSKVIDDSKYGLFPPFREESFTFKPIDVPRILHWFNDAKRVSLKQAEFEMRAENIENFEVDVDKVFFTPEEAEDLVFYCHNDVRYTAEILKYVTGRVDHPLYKGKDKLYDRIVVMDEVGLPCINWDDVKIGSEWNKLDYCKTTGKDERDLKPQKVAQPYGKKFKNFFPPCAKYQSKGLQDFVKKMGDTFVLPEKQEFRYTFSPDLVITVAKGGLHSNEKARFIQPEEDEIFLQNDIGLKMRLWPN